VQGDQDELVDIEATIAWVNQLLPGPELAVMAGAEHFFHGRLVELRELVRDFVQKEMGKKR
jgi:alpha/beta superfamily hydrolase